MPVIDLSEHDLELSGIDTYLGLLDQPNSENNINILEEAVHYLVVALSVLDEIIEGLNEVRDYAFTLNPKSAWTFDVNQKRSDISQALYLEDVVDDYEAESLQRTLVSIIWLLQGIEAFTPNFVKRLRKSMHVASADSDAKENLAVFWQALHAFYSQLLSLDQDLIARFSEKDILRIDDLQENIDHLNGFTQRYPVQADGQSVQSEASYDLSTHSPISVENSALEATSTDTAVFVPIVPAAAVSHLPAQPALSDSQESLPHLSITSTKRQPENAALNSTREVATRPAPVPAKYFSWAYLRSWADKNPWLASIGLTFLVAGLVAGVIFSLGGIGVIGGIIATASAVGSVSATTGIVSAATIASVGAVAIGGACIIASDSPTELESLPFGKKDTSHEETGNEAVGVEGNLVLDTAAIGGLLGINFNQPPAGVSIVNFDTPVLPSEPSVVQDRTPSVKQLNQEDAALTAFAP